MRTRTPRHDSVATLRNWLWTMLALALLPISGLVGPGPIATALFMPFAISVTVLGGFILLVGAMAIVLGLLR